MTYQTIVELAYLITPVVVFLITVGLCKLFGVRRPPRLVEYNT
jgi:hypothetical protein